MLDKDDILENIDIAFDCMSSEEFFETWRNLTDTLGGDFPIIYNKTEFDELIERTPDEKLTELVKKSPDFDENDLYVSIYDGQLHSTSDLTTNHRVIGLEMRERASELIADKKLTLGSKRLKEAFTEEDFSETMMPLDYELERFFESLDDESQEWGKYVKGCKKVGYDGKNGLFPMEESDILEDYWVETDSWVDEDGSIYHKGYYTNEVSDRFNFQDDWFYWNRKTGQYCSFTDWNEDIVYDLGYFEYLPEVMNYIIQTDDDLGIAGIREILDKNKKYGYAPQKDGN